MNFHSFCIITLAIFLAMKFAKDCMLLGMNLSEKSDIGSAMLIFGGIVGNIFINILLYLGGWYST